KEMNEKTITSLLSLPNEILLKLFNLLTLSLSDQYSLLLTNCLLSLLTQHVLIDTVFRTYDLIHGQKLIYTLASNNDSGNIEAFLNCGILSFIGFPSEVINMAIITQPMKTVQTLLNYNINADIPDDY